MPAQKNWVPSVAMKEGMPITAIRKPLTTPTSRPLGQGGEDGEPAQLVLLEQDREDEARERDHRGEGEVDLAGADDEGEPDREQDERRQGREEGRVDVGGQESLRGGVHEQRQDRRRTR